MKVQLRFLPEADHFSRTTSWTMTFLWFAHEIVNDDARRRPRTARSRRASTRPHVARTLLLQTGKRSCDFYT